MQVSSNSRIRKYMYDFCEQELDGYDNVYKVELLARKRWFIVLTTNPEMFQSYVNKLKKHPNVESAQIIHNRLHILLKPWNQRTWCRLLNYFLVFFIIVPGLSFLVYCYYKRYMVHQDFKADDDNNNNNYYDNHQKAPFDNKNHVYQRSHYTYHSSPEDPDEVW